MKRFLLFAFDEYYPVGGWEDYWGSFESLEDALAKAGTRKSDHFHVVDTKVGQIVADDITGVIY